MALGRMTRTINIVEVAQAKDAQGFVAPPVDVVIATVRAYKEGQHGSERWMNRAAFSTANALFRFRIIPGIEVKSSMFITDGSERYRITSVENVRGRNLYLEVLCEKLEGTVY